jgi:hypothetical protein
MKKITILLMCISLSIMSFSQELSTDERILLKQLDKDYSIDKKKVSLNYAWLLYRSGEGVICLKADTVLNQVISLQDNNPESPTYGHWGWRIVDGEKFVDWNSALFQSHILFCNLWNEQGKMSPAVRADFLTCCNRVLEAAKRRWDHEVFDIYRDYTAYSNIFALYIQTITLAADRYNSSLLRKTAIIQWARWYNHISFFGIDEFASLSYSNIIFKALLDIRDFCHDERMQKEAAEVLDHIYLLQSALTHPILKLPVSGISRDYRFFTVPGDARTGFLSQAMPEMYTPPQKAVEINEGRKYPFEVIGKASIMPFIFKSYQLEDAAMGSMTGGAVFQQQIHCMAAVGKSENERAVAFLQGSFTPVNGYTDQIGTSTLCVYNRLPAYWHLTQKHGAIDMSKYKETFGEFGVGITPNWKEKLNTPDHIILEAYDYDLHIFPFAVQDENIGPCKLVLKHRTTSSPRYHPRPLIFDEYVFPEEPDWFGAFIVLVKSGSKVNKPKISYTNRNGIRSFRTNMGHQLKLFVAEKGDTRQLFNTDPALIPLLKIIE